MGITIIWSVEKMDCYPQFEGQANVVFAVRWCVNATDGTFYATAYGTQGVTYVAGSSYTPYADLTPNQVVGWVQTDMGPEQVAQIESSVANQIDDQKNPSIATLPLPWSS
jgi:hypothetical protein